MNLTQCKKCKAHIPFKNWEDVLNIEINIMRDPFYPQATATLSFICPSCEEEFEEEIPVKIKIGEE